MEGEFSDDEDAGEETEGHKDGREGEDDEGDDQHVGAMALHRGRGTPSGAMSEETPKRERET
jgi:hypothetical protein